MEHDRSYNNLLMERSVIEIDWTRFERNREATSTSAEIIWNDDKGHRHISWTEPKGRGAISAKASVCVHSWLRSKRDDAPRVVSDVRTHDHPCVSGQFTSCITCHRKKKHVEFCKTTVALSFIEPVSHDRSVLASLGVLKKGKKKRVEHDAVAYRIRKPLPFKRKFWCAFSVPVALVFSERRYSEKAFSSMPAHLRRLLRFGPVPVRRVLSDKEKVFDVPCENAKYNVLSDIEKDFDTLLSEIVS